MLRESNSTHVLKIVDRLGILKNNDDKSISISSEKCSFTSHQICTRSRVYDSATMAVDKIRSTY